MNAALKPALRNALRTGLVLFAFSVVATALLVGTYQATEPHIARSQEAAKLALLNQVLPRSLYDNDLLATHRSLPPNPLLGTRQPSTLWIARRGDTVTAVVLEAVAPEGYSGDIGLLIGILADGSISGVRVTSHRETPGLGDYIERQKSPWVEQFVSKSLATPPRRRWAVVRDDGAFDARAGATITPRAVIKAVRNALDYFAMSRDALIPAAAPEMPAARPVQNPATAPVPNRATAPAQNPVTAPAQNSAAAPAQNPAAAPAQDPSAAPTHNATTAPAKTTLQDSKETSHDDRK